MGGLSERLCFIIYLFYIYTWKLERRSVYVPTVIYIYTLWSILWTSVIYSYRYKRFLVVYLLKDVIKLPNVPSVIIKNVRIFWVIYTVDTYVHIYIHISVLVMFSFVSPIVVPETLICLVLRWGPRRRPIDPVESIQFNKLRDGVNVIDILPLSL